MRGRAARSPWRAKEVEEKISVAGKGKDGGGFFSYHPRPRAYGPAKGWGRPCKQRGGGGDVKDRSCRPAVYRAGTALKYRGRQVYIDEGPRRETEGLLNGERILISRSSVRHTLRREYTHDLAKDQAADRAKTKARKCGERLTADRKMRL